MATTTTKIVTVSLLILVASIFIIEAQFIYPGYNYGYGYYGYGSYGSLFGYAGRGWYSVLCPDRTYTPGRCQTNLTCVTTGYVCVSPGICCRAGTSTLTSSVCPNGLATIYTCPFGVCLAGQTCVSGRCCVASTSASCPNGGTGIGTCVTTDSGLTCADGFTCTTVGGQSVCCANAASSPANGASSDSRAHSCPGNQLSTNITCSNPNQCSGFTTSGTSGVCLNQRCCSETAAASRRRAISMNVCPGEAAPVHVCKKENSTCSPCPERSFCNSRNGFCCPYSADMDTKITCVN